MALRASVPTVWAELQFRGKTCVLQGLRSVRDLRGGPRRCRKGEPRAGEVLVGESVGALWPNGRETTEGERALTLGKIHNLRLAAARVDGAFVAAGSTFSFWKQVGRAARRRGYVRGRELREGCLVPSVGGGLCQLSNALYDAALHAGLEIVERHAHTAVVAGSLAEVGRDATVFWNYVDLRFRAAFDMRIEAALTADSLVVRFWGTRVNVPAPATAVAGLTAARTMPTGDCATCAVESCFRHVADRREVAAAGRTAFLLDARWPEFDAYVASVASRDDVMFVPLDGRRRGLSKYSWDTSSVGSVRESATLALLRSYQSRRLASHGAARQRLLLAWAGRMADAFAARLPYDVTHVVVMQHLLPALWAGGHLGGRTYDVLMTGMPMRVLQRALDAAYALHPESGTLGDFRAGARLVDAEERALAGARCIITPHSDAAGLFGSRARRLAWAVPAAQSRNGCVQARSSDPAIVFPASTLGRAGAYEVREVARQLGLRVVLTGPDLERSGFWDGISVERAALADALAEAAAAVLPAFVENQPRQLLLAVAMGVPVVASDACGLGGMAGVATVKAGDTASLHDALERVRGLSDET